MAKGKKKPGKGAGKEVEDIASLSISDAPSTSQAQPAEEEEEEDEGGLTGGAKRKREKKKEAKKAEKEAKKVEKLTKEDSPVPAAPQPVTAPLQPAVEVPPTPPVVKAEEPKPAEEEDGLGLLIGGRKRQPRKKKPADAAKTSATAATAQIPVPTVPAPASTPSLPAFPTVQQPTTSAPAPSPWGRPVASAPAASSAGVQSVGSSQWAPPQTSQPLAATTPGPTAPAIAATRPGPSRSAGDPLQKITIAKPEPAEPQPRAHRSEVACRFKIPKKILGNQVPMRPVSVLTNYLPMTIKPLKIFRYDVCFKPDRPKKMLGKAFALSKEKHFKQNVIAFDQIKNCYSLTQLKGVPQNDRYSTNVEIKDPNGKIMAFEVSYKYTGLVDLGTIMAYVKTGATSLSPPTEAIQCIDVILRQGTLESYVKCGRQFFKRPAKPVDLGDGLEMWTGLFQSGIFTSRAFVNIDVAHKGFPRQQPLIKALAEFRLDPRKPLESQRGRGNENFLAFIKGLRVVANIGGDNSTTGVRREFICNGLVRSSNVETFCFEHPNGQKEMMTVRQYFEKLKGVRIQYPDLNCVWVGSREKTIFYPMELLEVSYGQAQNKQLNENQLATMVRQAATPPDERKRKIEEVIVNMNYSKNEYFKKFGLEISDQFHPVKAKILQPPQLAVGDGQTIVPRRGVWQANKVFKAEALQSWGVIAVDVDPRCNLENLISLMMSVGRSMGMSVSEPILRRFNVRIQDLQSVLFHALDKEVNFLFVVVSSRGRDYYHRVKQLAERDVGILTQCIKEFTANTRMNQQTAKNILLKVNSKLMGINQTLHHRSLPRCLQNGDVMVVGADVTHPSPDQSNIPSIAAVTASIDTKCFVYNIQLSIQTPKKEMIVEFEDMMVEHLQVYRKNQRGALPKKIYVFRDGVSEGQFAQVMNSELQAVHNAYRTVAGPNARPEVLFLLVQKRHHTRLFVPNSANNVEPGTVVDEDIVHASELDFYLVSHQAIKGTARPTRYHAVCNDGQIPHDEVEQLTYYLCHLYSRCMRAVSYPTPTYYAHLACLRARSLTFGEKFDNKELEMRPKRLRVMDKILQFSRMFFV